MKIIESEIDNIEIECSWDTITVFENTISHKLEEKEWYLFLS